MAETNTWPTLAYQDALRPPVGMRTGWALLTTYSAELRGVAAALLALAGSERENSGGTAMHLASAVQQLRGRVHVAVQSGRLARPRSIRQKMAVMLDSFVYHIARDERQSSWHPKIALVRFDALDEDNPNPHWRLWIGSRNLIGSENLELGVVLEQASAGGVEIEGLTNSLTWLATKAGLISRELRKEMYELSSVRWLLPDEWKQIAIRMHGQGADRKLPEAPDLVKELVIVSPFVDATTLRELSGWAEDGKRLLISTRDALRKIVAETPKVRPAGVSALYLRRGHGDGVRQPLRVNRDVTLDAGHFLARVVPLVFRAVGVLHALRINDQKAGQGVAPLFGAGLAN